MGSVTAEFEVGHRWRTTTLFSGRYALTAEHVHALSLQKLHLFDWYFRLGLHFACPCSSKYSVQRRAQRSRINVFSFFSTDWRWQWWRTSNSAVTAFIAKRPRVAYSCSHVLLVLGICVANASSPDIHWEVWWDRKAVGFTTAADTLWCQSWSLTSTKFPVLLCKSIEGAFCQGLFEHTPCRLKVHSSSYLPTVLISSGRSRFGDPKPTSRPRTSKIWFFLICPDKQPKRDFKPAFSLPRLETRRDSEKKFFSFHIFVFSFFFSLWHSRLAGSYPLTFATCLSVVFHPWPWKVQVIGAGGSHCWHGSNRSQAHQLWLGARKHDDAGWLTWERRKKISCRPWPHSELKSESSLLLLLGTSTKKRACLTSSKKVI